MDPVDKRLRIYHHVMATLKDRWSLRYRRKYGDKSDTNNRDFYFHKACRKTSSIPKSFKAELFLRTNPRCSSCGGKIRDKINGYGCQRCDLNLHLECAKYPPPEVIYFPQNHGHKLKLEMVETCFSCATCGKDGDGYPYKCHECGLTFHVNCGKYEAEVNHPSHTLHPLKLFIGEPLAYTGGKCRLCGGNLVHHEVFYHCSTCNFSLDLSCVFNPPPLHQHNLNTHDHVEVELPIHEHSVTPLKDGRMGDCCGIKFKAISDGYYCAECDYFFHKACSKPPKEIKYPSHKCDITLILKSNTSGKELRCDLCREKIVDGIKFYYCRSCCQKFHLDCAKYPPPQVIDVPQNHDHKLELGKTPHRFTCDACGKDGDGYSYKCYKCFWTFHVSCKKYAAEIIHPSHSLHPLKLFNGEPPAYTDGKCRLCGKKSVDEAFYHCSLCNYTLDLHCVLNPPPLYRHDLTTHDHKLTLMPKMISFTCTTCGLNGDRSPYVCLQCDFTVHNDCSGFPWVININRHDHRVSRVSLLGVVNSVCGVCQKKMDWTCGGYSCHRCHDSVFHTKCATRKDVWDGEEMKGKPEEDEDIEPFKVIGENTIQHFCHKKHNLKLYKSGTFVEEKSCSACAYPIYHHSFYSCLGGCCDFMLHESCANLPTRKRHVVSNKPYILSQHLYNCSKCEACGVCYNGFKYMSGANGLDVRCASVSEPFLHQSHPHPLFYTSPRGVCSACSKDASHVLRCVEDKCEYVLDFKCALLPYVVKHRVDDHFLSLCYGEKASGMYWCDICEKETDSETWFYTCKVCGIALHIDCVLGDFRGLEAGREVTELLFDGIRSEAVLNNSMSRPLCNQCKLRCIFPIILMVADEMTNVYYCSMNCFDKKYLGTRRYRDSIFLR